MSTRSKRSDEAFGASFKTINLQPHFNWPERSVDGESWKRLAATVQRYPNGRQHPWGVPMRMASDGARNVILAAKNRPEVTIGLSGTAGFICILHEWHQLPEQMGQGPPNEGLVVAEYELAYADGSRAVQPVRARFEVTMNESPGPAWLAVPFCMGEATDPNAPPDDLEREWALRGTRPPDGISLLYAMPNPHPDKPLCSLTIRGTLESPLAVAGLTLYRGASHPLRHLPRRTYRIHMPGGQAKVERAEVDLGGVARIEQAEGPRGRRWLNYGKGLAGKGETLLELFGAADAIITVKLEGGRTPEKFSLGEAFHCGRAKSSSGGAELHVLGRERQWMNVVVRDSATGLPAPVRIHFSGSRGEYIAPYGHHAQVNGGWLMNHGSDLILAGQSYAYVPGEFATELPVGDLYVELSKGFEYRPVRRKVTIAPGQKVLELTIERQMDWRSRGWVSSDTHVHFLSPHTAWLEAQCEGVNVVNILGTQWGCMYSNTGDFCGEPNITKDDTIVYVGTENRNHVFGHISMLGTKGQPVYPMCGGPAEA